ncbi:MAG: hypothetical protein NT080_07875 [Spirochaetes bacterium]|nr:hypothetical protein [Spirochaetota bacterium]
MMPRLPRPTAISLVLLACLLPGHPVPAEPFRTNVAAVITLSAAKPDGEQLSIGAADAIAIQFSEDSLFIQGIEIEVRIPRMSPSSVVWTLYKAVKPAPKTDRVAFEGDALLSQPLPDRVSMVLQVPVSERHALKSGPYATVLPTVIKARDFPIVFKLTPVSKGIPPELELSGFKLRIRPLLIDEGILRLSVTGPEPEPAPDDIEVFIDEKRCERWYEPVFLRKGSHSVQVKAPGFRDEMRTVVTEPARILDLAVVLQDTKPTAVFEAPANALIHLDGVAVDLVHEPKIFMEPGEHTVVCRIGDYTITRKFTAYRGKTYRIVLSVDLSVQESQ